jgi:pyruvate dehydrogenase E2 component (dihydrolipoamide acetyltransferase)
VLCTELIGILIVIQPVAIIVDEGQDVTPFEKFTIEDAGGDVGANNGDKKSEEKAPEPKEEAPKKSEEKPGDTIRAQESDSAGLRLQTSLERQPSISPAAKKLALEKGVAVGSLKGTGRGGTITKEDVEKAATGGGGSALTTAAAGPSYEDTPASSMRKTIASRLTQSMQTNPHYYVNSSVSVSKLLKLRLALNASSGGAYKLSVNDFLIKAIALAALKVPAANSAWLDQGGGSVTIRKHNTVDVSVAVATPTGLITPVVRNAHALGLQSISTTVKDLGKRARDGKLKPDEYQGGTITISNMGMNDAVERFTAVINPPQACIVAVGTVNKVAVPGSAEEGEEPGLKWDDQIVLTGSFDHKVVDGAVGGEFMRELKKIVEDPLKLLL